MVKRILNSVDGNSPERPVTPEIEILVQIAELEQDDAANGDQFLLDLVFYSLDYQEFRILPMGTVLHPEQPWNDLPNVLQTPFFRPEWIHQSDTTHCGAR